MTSNISDHEYGAIQNLEMFNKVTFSEDDCKTQNLEKTVQHLMDKLSYLENVVQNLTESYTSVKAVIYH